VNENFAYRQVKHCEHFYTLPIMIHITSENSSDSMHAQFVTQRTSTLQCISCHMSEQVWQEMDCSVDVRCVTNGETHRVSINSHTQFHSYIFVLSNSLAKICVARNAYFFCENPVCYSITSFYSTQTHAIFTIHIFITNYLLHVSVFVTPS
jgi:hypothetical protein